jgi:hypothetical protein
MCNATLGLDLQIPLVGRLTRVRERSQDPGRAPNCNTRPLPALSTVVVGIKQEGNTREN